MFLKEKLGGEVQLKECAFEVQTDEEQTHEAHVSAALLHAP